MCDSKDGRIYHYKRYPSRKKTPPSQIGLLNKEGRADRKNSQVQGKVGGKRRPTEEECGL